MLHAVMGEADLLGEFWASPQRHSLLVEGDQEMSQRRPLYPPVAPNLSTTLLALTTIAQSRLTNGGVVPIDLCFGLVAQEKLFSALLVHQPLSEVGTAIGGQVPLRSKLIRSVGDLIKVIEFHHFERVFFVQAHPIQSLCCLGGILRRLEGHNDTALSFCTLRVVGHVPLVVTILVDQLGNDVEELVVFLFGHLGSSCEEDGAWKAVIQPQRCLEGVEWFAIALRDAV
mmetsp:Transcript_79040/g.96645  ORF Transcript_79040/g.96645 Transcript_79040/m.96645 type:complete len:228 (+) Transcript_79040:471-1154(+)